MRSSSLRSPHLDNITLPKDIVSLQCTSVGGEDTLTVQVENLKSRDFYAWY